MRDGARGPWVGALFWVATEGGAAAARHGRGESAYATPQVAAILGVSEGQVRWLAHRGQLTTIARFGPLALYPMRQVLRLLVAKSRPRARPGS